MRRSCRAVSLVLALEGAIDQTWDESWVQGWRWGVLDMLDIRLIPVLTLIYYYYT